MRSQIRVGELRMDLPETKLPRFYKVRQYPKRNPTADIANDTKEAMQALGLQENIQPGTRILVAVGSRGIRDVPEIVAGVCAHISNLGAKPTVIGAMGSHGGSTVEGQRDLLSSLGVTEDRIGAPILTSTEATVVAYDDARNPVYTDPTVFAYDGLVAVNRIKPHTTARGSIQSGIVKMMVVGLGHQKGAEAFHRSSPAHLSETLVSMWRLLEPQIPFLGGIGIIDNAHKNAARVIGLCPGNLVEQETVLLEESRELMPIIPFEDLDVLVVREMGKEYSGTGMDTNVLGRDRIEGVVPCYKTSIDKVVVLDLSNASHGNACGIGLADFITSRLAEKIDLTNTYINVLTSRLTMRAMLPMIMASDHDAIVAAITASQGHQTVGPRILIIDNTLHLETMWASSTLVRDLPDTNSLEIARDKLELSFCSDGSLLPFS